ncbi:Josephin-like protein [Quillaja saponaria]|uniref:Josephin-like protein n=1 Tax=Quillaja saponaria TaxID=32244 RepID=A0AAD7L3Z5_QUISA|nr:Josephin-like protein [Quillaja saponaria]
MSRKSERVCLSSDDKEPSIFLMQSCGHGNTRVAGNRKRIIGIWTLRVPKDSKLSPVRLLLGLGAKVEKAIQFVSMRRRTLRKVSSSTLMRSHSLSDPTDSQRAEAFEDCIEFLHSSSSRQR